MIKYIRLNKKIDLFYKVTVLITLLSITTYLYASVPLSKSLQQLINEYTKSGYIPGIVLGVFKENSDSIFLVSGMRDIKRQHLINEKDFFKFGSVIKTITATIILNKLKIEKININSTIKNILVLYKNSYSKSLEMLVKKYDFLGTITINQLLNHTSYLIDEQKTKEYLLLFSTNRHFSVSLEEHIERSLVYGLSKRKFEYANINYIIIGKIIEIIFDKSFHEIISQEILKKINLYNTFYYYSKNDEDKICHNLARAYETVNLGSIAVFKDRPIFANYQKSKIDYIELTCGYHPSWDDGPAGGLVSTVGDIGKLINMLIINDSNYLILHKKINKNSQYNYKWFGKQKLFYVSGIWYGETKNGLHFWRLIGQQWGFSGGAIIFPKQKNINITTTVVYAFNTDAVGIVEGDDFDEGFISKILYMIEKNS